MKQKKTILITGSNGQLGQEFKRLANAFGDYEFLFSTRENLQLNDSNSIAVFFQINNVDIVINCGAYTAVDKAESNREEAFLINAAAPKQLAEICATKNIQLIHISTDYVFPGNGTQPYKETDDTHPVNIYGASKLEGEKYIQQILPTATIIRTSWVYSFYGNNFVKTMIRLMQERESINVVADQLGSPTYAADLANAILQMLISGKDMSGIFHYANQGVISWYDFATEIHQQVGSNCIVHPIVTSDYPTAAMRPEYSVMDTTKFRNTFNITIPEWKESLTKCIRLLKS